MPWGQDQPVSSGGWGGNDAPAATAQSGGYGANDRPVNVGRGWGRNDQPIDAAPIHSPYPTITPENMGVADNLDKLAASAPPTPPAPKPGSIGEPPSNYHPLDYWTEPGQSAPQAGEPTFQPQPGAGFASPANDALLRANVAQANQDALARADAGVSDEVRAARVPLGQIGTPEAIGLHRSALGNFGAGLARGLLESPSAIPIIGGTRGVQELHDYAERTFPPMNEGGAAAVGQFAGQTPGMVGRFASIPLGIASDVGEAAHGAIQGYQQQQAAQGQDTTLAGTLGHGAVAGGRAAAVDALTMGVLGRAGPVVGGPIGNRLGTGIAGRVANAAAMGGVGAVSNTIIDPTTQIAQNLATGRPPLEGVDPARSAAQGFGMGMMGGGLHMAGGEDSANDVPRGTDNSTFTPPPAPPLPNGGDTRTINDIGAKPPPPPPAEPTYSPHRPPAPDLITGDGNAAIYHGADAQAKAEAYAANLRVTLGRHPSKGGIPGAEVSVQPVLGGAGYSVTINTESNHASPVRSDQGQVSGPGNAAQGSPEARGNDLQRQAQGTPDEARQAPGKFTPPPGPPDGAARGRSAPGPQEPREPVGGTALAPRPDDEGRGGVEQAPGAPQAPPPEAPGSAAQSAPRAPVGDGAAGAPAAEPAEFRGGSGVLQQSGQQHPAEVGAFTKADILRHLQQNLPPGVLAEGSRKMSDTLGLSDAQRVTQFADFQNEHAPDNPNPQDDYTRLMSRVFVMDKAGDLKRTSNGPLVSLDPSKLQVGDMFDLDEHRARVDHVNDDGTVAVSVQKFAGRGQGDLSHPVGEPESFVLPADKPIPATAATIESAPPQKTSGQQLGLLGPQFDGGITGSQRDLFETRPDQGGVPGSFAPEGDAVSKLAASNPEHTTPMFSGLPLAMGGEPTATPGINPRVILNRLAGKELPALTEHDPATADQFVRHASSLIAAPHIARDFAAQVLGDQYKDPEFAHTLGGVLTEDNLRSIREDFQKQALAAKTPEEAQEFADKAARVQSLVGPDNRFESEAEYQKALADPKIQAAIERYKAIVNPWMDEQYRTLQKIAPDEPLPPRGLQTGARINLKAADRDVAPGGGGAGAPTNVKLQKSKFGRQASGAGIYDTDLNDILANSVSQPWVQATKARALQKLAATGGGQVLPTGKAGPEGYKPYPLENGRTIIANGNAIQQPGKTLWVRPDLYKEVRGALNLDDPMKQVGLAHMLNTVQLAGPTDAAWHAANITSAVSNAPGAGNIMADLGRKLPGVNVVDALARVGASASDVLKDSPEIRGRLARLASEGMLRGDTPAHGVTGKMLSTLDQAGRVTMDKLFDNLVERGLAKDTPGNRRNFVNQLGQYNSRLAPQLFRALKQSGLSPFATAGTTFNRLGVRALTGSPGFEATSKRGALTARAVQLAGPLLGTFAAAAGANYALSGKLTGRPGVPLGAIDTGATDDKGKPIYVDLAQWNGVRRGLHVTGIGPSIEALRRGQTGQDAFNEVTGSVVDSMLHPYLGPALRTGSVAATGQQLGWRDTKETEPVAPGGSVVGARALAAAKEASPVLKDAIEGSEGRSGVEDQATGAVLGVGKSLAGAVGIKSGSTATAGQIHGAQLNTWIEDAKRAIKAAPLDQRQRVKQDLLKQLDPQDRARGQWMLRRTG